jgi:ribosomal subunit interface protein
VKISVAGHHYSISDRTKTYVAEELEELEKFFSPIIDAHLTITEESKQHKVDLVVNVQAHTLKSSGEGEKVYHAIDQSLKRMTSQLGRLHDKQRGHRAENHLKESAEG